MGKQILGVTVGYIIFVISALLFFMFANMAPHAEATIPFMLITAIYGVVFSFLSGMVTQLISNKNNMKSIYGLGVIIAGFATFSIIKSEGNHWTQILAIFIFAPTAILGGYCLKILKQ